MIRGLDNDGDALCLESGDDDLITIIMVSGVIR